MLHVAESFIAREVIRKGEMKICDSCGRIIFSEDAIGAEDYFITEHGLVCAECVCKIKPLRVNKDDSNIWNGTLY